MPPLRLSLCTWLAATTLSLGAAPAWAAEAPKAPLPAAVVAEEGPGTWDGGVVLPLTMSAMAGLAAGGWVLANASPPGSVRPLALAGAGAMVVGGALLPWWLRPREAGPAPVGALMANLGAGAVMAFGPGLVGLAGDSANDLVDLLVVVGAPLAYGTSMGWSLGELASVAPARRGGPYPAPWITHATATGTGLATAATGLGLGMNLPSPLNFVGLPMILGAPTVGLGLGHAWLGDAPRGLFVGASLFGPLGMGVALPLVGTIGLRGSMGPRPYVDVMVAFLGGAAGLAAGMGAAAIDLEHRAGARRKPGAPPRP